MSEGPKKVEREESDAISIGRIPLKQVRVSRSEAAPPKAPNPMNKLVPYLDLFARLGDVELSRLADVETHVTTTLRVQVDEIGRALCAYVDLLPRLSDEELVRLTNAAPKTIRFWRLCQPRDPGPAAPRGTTAAPQGTAASTVASEGGSAADSNPSGEFRDDDRNLGDTGSYPIPRKSGDASEYMRFSGEPFPGFDAASERALASTQPAAGSGADKEDPFRGL